MILKNFKAFAIIITLFAIAMAISQSGCSVYRFQDVSIPDSVKFVKIPIIENKAPYVNPQLAPKLTDKLRQKITGQTKLSQTNGDDADWIINCTVTSYGFSTAGISNQQVNTNRLNIGVHIDVNDVKSQKTKKYDVSRSFDYAGTMSLQQAEQSLETDILRDLTDDIFNRIFSNW